MSFSLLETMRLLDGQAVRLERHLARMKGSAAWFGYAWDEAGVRRAVARAAAAHPQGCWRLRLLVSRDGAARVEVAVHAPQDRRTWRVALADAPIESSDPFLRNKTTRREVYDAARRARPEVDDVLLWNERGDVTEATIANVVAEIDGVRVTPPASAGLLPGVFRAELLEAGVIQERTLPKADLPRATRLWLINSLREWIEAELV